MAGTSKIKIALHSRQAILVANFFETLGFGFGLASYVPTESELELDERMRYGRPSPQHELRAIEVWTDGGYVLRFVFFVIRDSNLKIEILDFCATQINGTGLFTIIQERMSYRPLNLILPKMVQELLFVN